MLKLINYWLSSLLPQKAYWFLAGLVHPWEAVLENRHSSQEVYQESKSITKLLEKFHLISKKSVVLDIGCGVGRAEYALGGSVKKCVGVDISPSMIMRAKQHIKAKNIEFLVTSGNDLKDLTDNYFDLVFSLIVFQHLPRKIMNQYLQESFRVLKKGGKIFFQIPLDEKKQQKEPPLSHPWALRYYSQSNLKKLLKAAGFGNIKLFSVEGKKLGQSSDQALVIAQKL